MDSKFFELEPKMTNSFDEGWSGIGFRMQGYHFVVPLGEVSEVITFPKCVAVPQTKAWMKGVANHRGKILSVTDLQHFISGHSNLDFAQGKVLVFNYLEECFGLAIEKVVGIQNFNKSAYFSDQTKLDQIFQPYCQGFFVLNDENWHVFSIRLLFKNSSFINAAQPILKPY